MKKINYIETEEELQAKRHGFEFHYKPPLSDDDYAGFIPSEPVAHLEPDGWWNNKSKPIRVLIHPVSSPKLIDMGEKPELIIAEVKEAIELYVNNPTGRIPGQITEHVWIWVNG